MDYRQAIVFVVGTVVVVFGAYLATYYVARGSRRLNKGRMIHILDRFELSKDKSILVIEVLDQVYLVAFSSGAITLLDKPDPEAVRDLAAFLAQPDSPIHGSVARVFSRLFQSSSRSLRKHGGAEEDMPDPNASAPFESFLHNDDLDRVYNRIQSRKEKEKAGERDSFEEDSSQ